MKVTLWLFLLCTCVDFNWALLRRVRIPCPTVLLSNGRVRVRQKSGFAQFQCFKGYLLAGEKYSRCVNGNWDSPRPKCVRASCQKIKPPANGLIHASHRGAVLNFFCRPGYELHGPNMTSCDGRTWDSYLPACLPTNTIPTLSCDFETDDLCGWSHDLNHNFDWTRMNFKTPSGHVGTGPAFDHTKGENGNGYYMYIESSSRNINDTARLISPVYERQDNDTCLEFFYHMYGFTTGQLRVYVKKISELWVFKAEKAVFWKSGNHGNQWLKSVVRLGVIDEDFQIIFEGVRGSSYISDIAIDDVKLIENCVEEDDFTTTTTESETYSSTEVIAYGSCLNRCDSANNTMVSPYGLLINCDCDDACVDRNSCCPDYITVCVLSGFSTDYTDYFVTTTETADDIQMTTQNITETVKTTEATTPSTTTRTTIRTTPSTTRTTTTTTRTTTYTTRTTPSTINLTTKKRIPPTKKISTTVKPPKQKSKKVKIIDDIATLPTFTEDVSVAIVVATMTTVEAAVKEKAATITEKKTEPSASTSLIVIAIASICSVVIGAVLVAFLVRRYSRNSCLRIKKMKSGNGDSQSDVRFLTSDEVLDFNLPSDYHTM